MGQSSDNKNSQNNESSSGGNKLASGSVSSSGANQLGQKTNASSDGSGNSLTTVDASDRSNTTYNSKTTVWAPVVHGPAAPALGVGVIAVMPSTCGPRVKIVQRPVVGVRFGVWGGQTDVAQGYDEILEDADEPFVQRGEYRMGHEVVTYTATLGTSSAGSLSLSGFGKNGDGAQGGGATSGALQQLVQRHTVRQCVMAQKIVPVGVLVTPRPAPQPLPIRG